MTDINSTQHWADYIGSQFSLGPAEVEAGGG